MHERIFIQKEKNHNYYVLQAIYQKININNQIQSIQYISLLFCLINTTLFGLQEFYNNCNQIIEFMFKIGGDDPISKERNVKMRKIKCILSKTIKEIHLSAILQENNLDSPLKRISQQSSEDTTQSQVLQNLKRGYFMSKHSINTDAAHPKFVYLSEDLRQLCWKTPDRDNEKRIKMSSITKIVKEDIFLRQCATVKNMKCSFGIISTTRNLWLEAPQQIQAEIFIYELKRALWYARRMSQNYKYSEN